jgi:predicted DCC family thiol-disulfide oxidoreductase YuxK
MNKKLRVFFDGACPICSKEISVYKNADRAGKIDWIDVSAAKQEVALPLSTTALLARFHVQTRDGTLISGARGFIEMWRHLPRWRGLARICSIPGVPPLLELSYRGFLRIRPTIQRILIRR